MSYAEAQVGLYDAVTPAVRIGPWVGRGCVGLVVVGLLVGLGQYRRSRRPVAVLGVESTPTDRTLV
jgi:apolipoprotein N-acyltransferase